MAVDEISFESHMDCNKIPFRVLKALAKAEKEYFVLFVGNSLMQSKPATKIRGRVLLSLIIFLQLKSLEGV